MQLVGVTLAALASLATAESLKKLDTSLTILTNNDLQGKWPWASGRLRNNTDAAAGSASPDADSAVILTDARPYQDVSESVCAKLGEKLWKPTPTCKRDAAVLPFSEYLKFDGKADGSSKFWVASNSGSNAVDIAGRYNKPASNSRLPGLCTNTAPYSTGSSQNTSSQWQISLDVNGQTLTGYVTPGRE